MHVDMTSYEKIYDLKAENELPERIFLDKGTSYSFSVFLTSRKPEVQHGLWAGPGWRRGPGIRLGHAPALTPPSPPSRPLLPGAEPVGSGCGAGGPRLH